MIARAQENPFVRTAAIVANQFKIDPITVLESDYKNYAIRVAAANYAAEQEQKAINKNTPNKT